MNRPPFQITDKVLNLVSDIQTAIGKLTSVTLPKPSVQLRKQNKIKTIRSSLGIEGNTLNLEQVKALVDNKRILGPKKDIIEVKNAIRVYDSLNSYNPLHERDLLRAHAMLMRGLVENPGRYRKGDVGIFKDGKVSRMAPPAKRVSKLMHELFDFVAKDKNISFLIRACVFHYEFELIHPFSDGNGRMGRLWQQLLLIKHSPLFEFTPVETLIQNQQKKYYEALEKSDNEGSSTIFLEFALELILQSLKEFDKAFRPIRRDASKRMEIALEKFGNRKFSRKDYMQLFKEISSATASRDLAAAVKNGTLKVFGVKARAKYNAG